MEDFFTVLRSIERKWQNKWEEKDIFKGIVDPARPKYFVTIPYPYASGALHVGHARTYTLGDVFTRFKRQQGYNTLWPMAFHITGTPVLSVSAKIREGNKKTIDIYKDYVSIYETNPKKINEIIKSFVEPINVAMYFANNMISDFRAMGYSLDVHRQFTTGDVEYNKFIEWQYNHLIKKKYIVQGEHPILWCLKEENAVGEDDIKDADVDKVEVQDFVALKFALENAYLIAGTFRPETIYGATNIWLHPTATYCRVEIDDEETWIISIEAAEKLEHQNHRIKILEKFQGSKLIGKEAFAPRVPNRPLPILPATFVDPDHATGVVYSVPAHAPYDYIALRDLQEDNSSIEQYDGLKEKVKALKPIALISVDEYGEFPAVEIVEQMEITNQNEIEKLEEATQEIYSTEFYNGIMMDNTEEFAGLKVEEAKEEVAIALKAEGRADSFYEASRKAISRSGGKIIVAVLPDQYFLNYGDNKWKLKAKRALDNMEIVPVKYRRSFESTFDWLNKRPCVRKRGLGTEFPLTKGQGWIIESLSDSVIYMAFYTIIPHIKQNKITAAQLIPEFFDYVFLSRGSKVKVAQKTGINPDILSAMKNEFEYWYPNDLRHTAIAHIGNHLSFAIFHHVAIFPEKYWLKCFSLNELLIREGEKMSKSAGNIIPIAHLPKQYSVDVTRFYLVAAGSADTVLNWTEEGIATSVARLRKFWNIANEIISIKDTKKFDIEKASFMTRAFIATCLQHLNDAIMYLEAYNGREYVSSGFHLILKEVEQYYKSSEGIVEEERMAALQEIIDSWIVILSPLIPHMCEELNEKLGKNEFCSLRLLPKIEVPADADILHHQLDFISDLIEDARSILGLKRSDASKISIFIAPEWKQFLYKAIAEIIGEGAFNMGTVMSELKKSPQFQPKMSEIAKELKSIRGDAKIFRKTFIGSEKEKQAITGCIEYLKKIFACPVEYYVAESEDVKDPMNRASRAQPMKPALYIEL